MPESEISIYLGYGIEYPLKLAKLHLSTPPANINNKLDSRNYNWWELK